MPPQAFFYSPSRQERPAGIKQKGGIQRGGVLAQVFFHLPRGRLQIPEQGGAERCQDHHQAFGSFPPSNDWFYSRGFSKTVWNLWLNPHPSSLPKGPQSHPPNDHHHFSSVFGCKMNPTSSHRRSERKREWAYTGISTPRIQPTTSPHLPTPSPVWRIFISHLVSCNIPSWYSYLNLCALNLSPCIGLPEKI